MCFRFNRFSIAYNIPGFMLMVDFEKAFDVLDWRFIRKTPALLNFRANFLNCIDIFYSDSRVHVCNNCYSTGFLSIQRGMQQGCPLDSYLLIPSAEVPSF